MTNFHVFSPAEESIESPVVREISYNDVFSAIRPGFDDFMDRPSHYAFLVLIYPLMGFAMVAWAVGGNSMQLVYPLLTGFALIGPIAAIGLYEISRRREQGLDTAWRHARAVWRSPAMRKMQYAMKRITAANTRPVIRKVTFSMVSMEPQFEATGVHHQGLKI